MSEPWRDPGPMQPIPIVEPRKERRGAIYETQWFTELAIPAGFGALFALPAMVAVVTDQVMHTENLPGRVAPSCGLGLLTACVVFVAVVGLVVFLRRALWTAEALTGKNLYPGGPVGDKDIPTRKMEITVNKGHRQQREVVNSVSDETLIKIATDVLAGVTTLSGRGIARYSDVSPQLANSFIHELVGFGWARWKNEQHHQQGVDLTPNGVTIFRAISETEPDDVE